MVFKIFAIRSKKKKETSVSTPTRQENIVTA
jgi:hypothetical protein